MRGQDDGVTLLLFRGCDDAVVGCAGLCNYGGKGDARRFGQLADRLDMLLADRLYRGVETVNRQLVERIAFRINRQQIFDCEIGCYLGTQSFCECDAALGSLVGER